MRLHTDIITAHDIWQVKPTACSLTLIEHGSRKRDHAFELRLTGWDDLPGGVKRRRSAYATEMFDAATWDEWGWFFAGLFEIDPNAWCAYYDGAENFHWQTGDRFAGREPQIYCAHHSWTWAGVPRENECVRKGLRCGAIRRWPA